MPVGDNIDAKPGRWTFEGAVTENFSEHVAKSVPLYHEGHELIVQLSDFFVMDGSVCYDLGSSNGDLTLKIAKHNADKNARFIGIDAIEAMVETANKRKSDCPNPNVEFVQSDILAYAYEPADLITAYYTMQFIRPKVRQRMLDIVFETLNWGGAFVIFEKVRAPDARFQDIITTLYLQYKKQNGYNNEEILEKMFSLKGVLDPFSSQANVEMLQRAGFRDILPIAKYLCFEGFLAIK